MCLKESHGNICPIIESSLIKFPYIACKGLKPKTLATLSRKLRGGGIGNSGSISNIAQTVLGYLEGADRGIGQTLSWEPLNCGIG